MSNAAKPLKILFIGDVVGSPGRKMVSQALPRLIPRWGLDLVVCNAENAAGGSGLTLRCYEELVEAGVDVMTMGDHVYRKDEIFQIFDRTGEVLRPANYPPDSPGPELALVDGPRRHPGRRLHRAGPDLHAAGRRPVPRRRPHARRPRLRHPGDPGGYPRRGHQRQAASGPLPRRPRLGRARHPHPRRHRRRADPQERHRLSDRRRHDRPARLDHRAAVRPRPDGDADLRPRLFRRRHRRPPPERRAGDRRPPDRPFAVDQRVSINQDEVRRLLTESG